MSGSKNRLSLLSGSCALAALLALSGPAMAATFTVTSTSGDPTVEGSLGWAINQANSAAGADTITFDASLAGQTITLGRMLPVISDDVTIDGSSAAGISIDGSSSDRIFFVDSGDVTISNMTLKNGLATGGNGGDADLGGGGGGMGAGGALFIRSGANVTIDTVSFENNGASGGQGGRAGVGAGFGIGGGGGGMGGHGGDTHNDYGAGGGGGFGLGADGGGLQISDINGKDGALPGGPGAGGVIGESLGTGGANAGGGGSAIAGPDGLQLGGGGGQNASGGDGGFGGGGGGAHAGNAGQGGFGGGGGGSGGPDSRGGDGGFGGGGGRGNGIGGFGGGDGPGNGGGGGAGFGGAIFVMDGGTLTIRGDASMSGGNVAAGAAGHAASHSGLGLGSGFYLHGTTGLTVDAGEGETIIIADDIASDAYNDPDDPDNADAAGDGLDTGITKTGDGTLVLGGNNSFVGGVNASGGTVSISSDANLGHTSGSVSLDDAVLLATGSFTSNRSITMGSSGGAVSVDGSNTVTMNGVISGPGGLAKEGTGTLVLGNSGNSYEGGTAINDGTLQLGADNAIPSGDVFISATGILDMNGFDQVLTALAGDAGSQILMGSGTLTIDQAMDTTYAGTITGTGDFIKKGSGTLTLVNPIDTTGSVTVEGGSLAAGSENVFGNDVLTIEAGGSVELNGFNQTVGGLQGLAGGTLDLGNATLTLNQDTDTTFGGAITNDGKLVKNGTGTLTYTGTGTTTGTIDVAGGAFNLEGNLDSAPAIIREGADFYGSGGIGGLHVFGRLAPGDLPPQEIIDNGTGPDTQGVLAVHGDIIFEPGSMLLADMAADGTMNLITATGKTIINGGTVNVFDDDTQFDPKGDYVLIDSAGGITGEFDDLITNLAFLEPWLTYDDTQVRLTFFVEFDPSFYSGNAGGVGEVIAELSGNTPPGPLSDLIDSILKIRGDQADQVLAGLVPEVYADATMAARRLLTGGDRMVTNRFTRDPAPGVQFWTDYQFRAVDLGFDGNASGGTSHEHHQIFGADMSLGNSYGYGMGSALVGVYGGFAWADLELDRIRQQASIMGPLFGIYGQWSSPHGAMLYGRGSFAAPRVTGKRHYGTDDYQLAAEGEYRMTALGANIGLSYNMVAAHALVTPFAEVGVQHLSRPKSRENGADDAGLIIKSGDMTTGDARIGANIAALPVDLSEAWVLKPALSAAYVRSLGPTRDKVEAAFIGGADVPFTTTGVDIGKDAANVALNLELAHRQGFASVRLGYGLSAAKHEISHTVGIAGSLFW